MRRCFQCGTMTPQTDLVRVGDGEFCKACFQSLLADESLQPVATEAASPPAVEPPTAPEESVGLAERCLVCEVALPDGLGVDFLMGRLCEACVEEMNRELDEAEKAAPLPDAPNGSEASSDPNVDPAEVFTPGAGTALCDGCERPMPGPGSYRVILGRRYCAACVPFYSQHLHSQPVVPAGSEARVRPGGDAAVCDCCQRPLDDSAQSSVGYRLCGACASSDREAATAVARVRHRRRIQQWQAELSRGET